jgi:poly(A) polymerase
MRPLEPTDEVRDTAPEGERPGQARVVLGLAAGVARGESVANELTAHLHQVAWEGEDFGGERALKLFGEILLGDAVEEALQWLHEAAVLAVALPEVEATVDLAQEMGRRHKDVWKHTKQVVAQCVREETVRWAALLHDIGKVPTRVLTPEGKVTFHGHPEAGARLFDRISRRLAFPKPLRTQVRFLILHHLRANQYDRNWTDSAVRRFDREMGEHLEPLLQLSRADVTSAHRQRREQALQQIEELTARIAALREIDSRTPPLPSGLGNHIMARFGLPPGRQIGELRRALEVAIEEERLEPHREADYYLDHVAQLLAARADSGPRGPSDV